MRQNTHTNNIVPRLDQASRWRRTTLLLASLCLFLLPACGEEEGGTSPQCINSDVTQVRSDVDFIVQSPLPPELGVSCPQGSDLEAFLVVPGAESCVLTITQAEVRGCCVDYPTNQNVQADLYFRRAADGIPLGSQSKLVSLPEETTPSISISFENVSFDPGSYDLDGDGTLNIDEYCSGSL